MELIRTINRKINLALRRSYFNRHYKVEAIPTIVSPNCLGGFIYHDANLQFISPTINLTFDPIDFLNFCDHLDDLTEAKIEEVKIGKKFPTGKITYNDGLSSIVYFVHYTNFKEAVTQFKKRTIRMNDNVCVLLTVAELTDEIVIRFNKLSYEKKCFYLLNKSSLILDNSLFVFITNNSHNKDLLNFKKPFSRKLILDYNLIDYYSACGFTKKF